MKELIATIERNEDSFFAYVNELDGCVAGGASYAEVKSNLEEILQESIEADPELHRELNQNYRLNFEVSLESVFDLIPEVNITQLARLGGINPGLLRQYVSGTKKASEKQAKRVMEALDKLISKLNSLSITA